MALPRRRSRWTYLLTLKGLLDSAPPPNQTQPLCSFLLCEPDLLLNPGNLRYLCLPGFGLGRRSILLHLLLGSNLSRGLPGLREVDKTRVVGRPVVSNRGLHAGGQMARACCERVCERGRSRGGEECWSPVAVTMGLFMLNWNWAHTPSSPSIGRSALGAHRHNPVGWTDTFRVHL